MRTDLFELNIDGERRLCLSIAGVYYTVRPASPDEWNELMQAAQGISDREKGRQNDFRVSYGRMNLLALGDTLEEMRANRPGREKLQAAALCAIHWHLNGLKHAQDFWAGLNSKFEVV